MWVLSWRLCLNEHYLSLWDPSSVSIENASQRIQEDTFKFARGILTCFVVLMDSVLTLVVFSPILCEIGSEISDAYVGHLPDSWLLLLCLSVVVVGLVVSIVLGWELVDLEVNNQRVEASLRRQLVLTEEGHTTAADVSAVEEDQSPKPLHTSKVYTDLYDDLFKNYKRLYKRFALFSLWLGSYEQMVVILPYFLVAPRLFDSDADHVISFGTVIKVSNAFSNVFSALNVISDRWVDVTDWLSVMKRLYQWERVLSRPRILTDTHMSSSSNSNL